MKTLIKGHTAIAWPGRVRAWIPEGTFCPWRPEEGHDLAGVGLWLAPLQHFAKQPGGNAVGGDFREFAGAQAIPWRPLHGCNGPPNRYVCKQVSWRPQPRGEDA